MSGLSFFDEKRGVVVCECEWGQWWQTVHELHMKLPLPAATTSKLIKLQIKPKHISLKVRDKLILEGPLSRTVVADETLWTIEDGHLCVVLVNARSTVGEEMWESLIEGGIYAPDPLTLHEMRKNLDLEKFQMENPGFDFSRAQLSKQYDKMPGWSKDRLQELQEKSRSQEQDES